MKKTSFLLFVLFLVGILTSCHKEPEKSIAFGNTKGMTVTVYDSIMEYDDDFHPFILDLNNNGIGDIKIQTNYDGPLAIGEFQTLTIYCLNENVELQGEMVEKESYIHRDSIVSIENGWTTITYDYCYSNCEPFDENDQVDTSVRFELYANNYGDPINVDDYFQSTELTLFRESYEYQLHDQDYETQIDVVNHSKYIFNCWNFPSNADKYIGFKITKDGQTRLGWLKLRLIGYPDDDVVNVQLLETAIQE